MVLTWEQIGTVLTSVFSSRELAREIIIRWITSIGDSISSHMQVVQTHLLDYYRANDQSATDRARHSQAYLDAGLADQNLDAEFPGFASIGWQIETWANELIRLRDWLFLKQDTS